MVEVEKCYRMVLLKGGGGGGGQRRKIASPNFFSGLTEPVPQPLGQCCGSATDPDVFGPPGSASGSVFHMYGSGSFHHQPKIVRKIKTLISTVL
jgi:hypothetical protein